MMLKFY